VLGWLFASLPAKVYAKNFLSYARPPGTSTCFAGIQARDAAFGAGEMFKQQTRPGRAVHGAYRRAIGQGYTEMMAGEDFVRHSRVRPARPPLPVTKWDGNRVRSARRDKSEGAAPSIRRSAHGTRPGWKASMSISAYVVLAPAARARFATRRQVKDAMGCRPACTARDGSGIRHDSAPSPGPPHRRRAAAFAKSESEEVANGGGVLTESNIQGAKR